MFVTGFVLTRRTAWRRALDWWRLGWPRLRRDVFDVYGFDSSSSSARRCSLSDDSAVFSTWIIFAEVKKLSSGCWSLLSRIFLRKVTALRNKSTSGSADVRQEECVEYGLHRGGAAADRGMVFGVWRWAAGGTVSCRSLPLFLHPLVCSALMFRLVAFRADDVTSSNTQMQTTA